MWSYKRTAGTQLGWAGLPAVLFLFWLLGSGVSFAEDGKEDAAKLRAAIGIHDALEIEFFAEVGKIYAVEAQSADGTWVDIYGPVYGKGAVVEGHVLGATEYADYRLEVIDLAGFGHAPSELDGHAYSLNYGSKVVGLTFVGDAAGIVTGQDGIPQGFAYSYQKTSPEAGKLSIEFADGRNEELSLRFYHGRVGTFGSEVARDGQRARKSSGTFRAGGDVNPDNAVPPLSLEGSKFIFRDRGMTSILTFTTDFSGSLSRQGGDTEVISYTYDISSWPEASIMVALAGTDVTHEYTLNFAALNAGTFMRRVFDGARIKDLDRGKFSGKGIDDGDDDGKGGGDTEGDCLAPSSVKGRTLQASVGGKVVTILLDGANTGSVLRQLGDGRVALQAFSYTYKKLSATEALLTVTLPTGSGDEVQVFELEFTSKSEGNCERRRYKDDELKSTEDGDFTLSGADGGGAVNDGEKDDE